MNAPAQRRVLLVTARRWPTHAFLPHLLADAGFAVTLLGPRRSGGFSRFLRQIVEAPNDPAAVAATLRDHLAANRYDWIVVCEESVLSALDAYAGEAWLRDVLPFDSGRMPYRILDDKHLLTARCTSAGVACPRTELIAGQAQAAEAARAFGYPVVVKTARGHGGAGVSWVGNQAALEAALQSGDSTLAIQPWIAGRSGTTEVLFDRGRPYCWASSFLVDCWPKRTGPSSARRFAQLPEMYEVLKTLGELTGFHGLAGCDWIVERETQTLYFLEFNPRPQTGYDVLPATRTAFANAIRQMFDGIREPLGEVCAVDGATVEQFPQHLYFVHAQFPGMLDRTKRALRTWKRADWSDPAVVLTHAIDYWRWVFGRSFARALLVAIFRRVVRYRTRPAGAGLETARPLQ